jgi:hypothetical protein
MTAGLMGDSLGALLLALATSASTLCYTLRFWLVLGPYWSGYGQGRRRSYVAAAEGHRPLKLVQNNRRCTLAVWTEPQVENDLHMEFSRITLVTDEGLTLASRGIRNGQRRFVSQAFGLCCTGQALSAPFRVTRSCHHAKFTSAFVVRLECDGCTTLL